MFILMHGDAYRNGGHIEESGGVGGAGMQESEKGDV